MSVQDVIMHMNREVLPIPESRESYIMFQGAERLRGLLKILPEPEEVDLLRNFDGDVSKLGAAEQFLLELILISDYKLRIECKPVGV